MTWSPDSPTTAGNKSPYAWFRADSYVFKDAGATPAGNGETVQEWQTRNGDHSKKLTQSTAGNRPTLNTSFVDGQAGLTFDGSSDSLLSNDGNGWKFLHDGTGATCFFVWRTTNEADNAGEAIFNNGALSSGNVGYNLWYDNRSGIASQRLAHSLTRGGGLTAWVSTENASGQGASLHITTTHGDSAAYSLRRDGLLGYDSDAAMTSPSSNNPTYPVEVAKQANASAFYLAGTICEILIYNASLSMADVREVWTYLSNRYPSATFADSDISSTITLADDSTHNGFPTGARSANGTLIAMWTQGASHAGFDKSTKYRLSYDNGATWQATQTLLANDATYSYHGYVSEDQQGKFHVSIRRDNDDGSHVEALHCVSSDNGATWSTPVDTNASANFYYSKAYVGATVFKTASGRLLLPVYGLKDQNDTLYTTGLVYSDDDGSTWTYALIADGQTDGRSYTEAGFYEITGYIVCIIRLQDGGIWYSTSANNGLTWSAAALITSEFSGMPCMNQRAINTPAVMVARYTAESDRARLLILLPTARVQRGADMDVTTSLMVYGRPIFAGRRMAIVWAQQNADTDANVYFEPFASPTGHRRRRMLLAAG